jgi:hypothetical protein
VSSRTIEQGLPSNPITGMSGKVWPPFRESQMWRSHVPSRKSRFLSPALTSAMSSYLPYISRHQRVSRHTANKYGAG